MSAAPVLSARGLCRDDRGHRLLGPVDLDVAAGEALAIVGRNGAGKTTLLRLLGGLLAPSAGSVRLDGADLAGLARRRVAARVVYLPQHTPAAVPLSVERYLLLARYPHREGWRDDDAEGPAIVAAALARHGLEPVRARPLAELSGGERQLVQLVAAEIQGGDVWLVDEPTTHLDPAHQRQVARHLAGLRGGGGNSEAGTGAAAGSATEASRPAESASEGEGGWGVAEPPGGEAERAVGSGGAPTGTPTTLVVATHDLNLAASLASRVVAVAGGRVVADGPPDEVLAPDALERLFGAPFLATGEGSSRRVWLAP
jgi:ABC-type cobalamin/Fe3+-siderophores transport system ATPase subunit